MGQSLEILKKEALKCAGEAFTEHKEQIFEALQLMCQCSCLTKKPEFIGNVGLIGGPELQALERVLELWEEEKSSVGGGVVESGQYSDEILALSISERDVPLTELLIFSMRKISSGGCWDDHEEEILKEAAKNGYAGYEYYVAFIYLTGAREIFKGERPEHFYKKFRVMVPEQWLEDYDDHCQEWMEEMQEKKEERVAEIINASLEKETFVRTTFHRTFGEMEPEKLRYILKEIDCKTLAVGTAFAEESVMERFWDHMEKRQREYVMEKWRRRDYDYHLKDILAAMERLLIVDGLS